MFAFESITATGPAVLLIKEMLLCHLRGEHPLYIRMSLECYASFRETLPEEFNSSRYIGQGDTFAGFPYRLGLGSPEPYGWVTPFELVTRESLERAYLAANPPKSAKTLAVDLLDDILCDLAENNNVTELEREPGHTVVHGCHSVSRGIEIDGVRYMLVVATKGK